MLKERRVQGAREADVVFIWFHGRFWPELLRIHKQAGTMITLIAEQQPAPARLPDRLIDPRPLLRELAQLPGADGHPVAGEVRAYLLAWQRIRRVAITQRPIRDGGALFGVMTHAACYFADVMLASQGCGSERVQ